MAQEEDEYSFYQWLHLDLHIMIIVQDDHRRRWQRGDWTDDTDMMLCILDSFVACQKVDILDIARRFKEWMMNGGMGIGRHTYNVMALGDYTSNPQKAAEIIWKMGKKKAAANGTVMRTSVVGLLKENVASNAENICKLTHFDPRCVGSCVIVSSIIHALVFEDRILDYEDVIGIARQYDERIVPFIDLAYHEGLDSLCLDDEKSMGYTLRTLGATQNPAGITASRIHFQKPNLKFYLVISIYAISIIIEPDIHCHNLRAKKMGNVILYVTITI